MTDISDIEIQKKIQNFILENPGLTIGQITKKLDINISTLEKNLSILERKNIINVILEEGYLRYYIDDQHKYSDENKLETREQIYRLITVRPGIHLSKIAGLLNMSKALAAYHLRQLEKERKITVTRESGFNRYYSLEETIGVKDKEFISLLRKEIPLKIILYLSKHGYAKHKEMSEYFDVSPSTLSYHLNILVKKGIIGIKRFGEVRGYYINDRSRIVNLVLKYRLHVILDGFKDLWDDLSLKHS